MCTFNNLIHLHRVLKGKEEFLICYKVVVRIKSERKFKLFSPYYHKEYKPGTNTSNYEKEIPCLVHDKSIWEGIHVYFHYKDALGLKRYLAISNKNVKIIKVICYKKDLIGCSDYEAVFTEVYLTKEEYKKKNGNIKRTLKKIN